MEPQALAILDTQGIHDYVFSSNELAQIRGASALLHHCTVTEWERLLQSKTFSGKRVFCGGGNAVALFDSTRRAEAFCRLAERRLRHKTVVARAAWHVEPRRGSEEFPGGGADSWSARAFRALNRKKREGAGPEGSEFNPYAKFCEWCGVRTASRACQKGATSRWTCAACAARLGQEGGAWFEKFRRSAHGHRSPAREPADLNEIGEHARPAGYVAFVYLDVNGLGRRFARITSMDEYEELSRSVAESLQEALFGSVADAERFEIFLCGGDEASLVLPANLAAEFAVSFLGAFDKEMAARGINDAPGVSIGMVYAHSHFPVRMAIRHTEDLLRSCKRRAQESKERHLIDYLVVSNAIEQPIEELRKEQFVSADERPLTSRPLNLAEFAGVRELSGILARMPRQRAHALYDIVFGGRYQSVVDYCYWLSRLEGDSREEMRAYGKVRGMVVSPFDAKGKTPVLDAIELLEFGG